MNPWMAHLRHAWQRAGVPGLLGCALCLCAAGVWFLDVPALQQERDEQAAQVELLRHQLQAGAAAVTPAEAPLSTRSEQAWRELWQALPTQAVGEAQQADVLVAAQRQGFTPVSVQFSGDRLKALDTVWRQRVTLPVEAPYPAVRAWLAEVLRHPNISLDALDLSRPEVMSERVKARVVLSLWWKLDTTATEPPGRASP